MVLTLEWEDRLLGWIDELPRHFYRPLGAVDLEGFVTQEQLTPEEALAREFEPMPPGTPWGPKWAYGWFKGALTLPETAAGQSIVLAVDVGGGLQGAPPLPQIRMGPRFWRNAGPGAESIIFVNGRAAGARDRQHYAITLSEAAAAGSSYDILIEGYAGHGPRVSSVGPVPLDRASVPEPGPTQVEVGHTTFGIWHEDVYQLWIDVMTLWQTREKLHPDSLRVQEIDAGLRDFTLIVDYELPQEEMLETVRACRERLKPLLEAANGSTVPKMYAFGHSHIDVAWLWPLQETERKMGRTTATQLALMEQYPEYIFLQSQPHLYRMLEDRYPELYERLKAAIERGQVIPEGGTWVEPDTNITGGESLIRQFIHGKRFFREEFGVESELLWLPDVFGYSGALPQIMRGCGVKYFSTQKIFWAYHGGETFPYNTFTWEGIDGSEVYVHLHNDYNALLDAENVINRWRERVQKDGFSTRLYPFGFGDGGGGPTRDHLEFARRLKDFEGVPQVVIAGPMDYFHDQDEKGWPDARYVGELYFQAHRGVLTSQAKTKKGNRKSEFALRRAELWGVAARARTDFDFSAATLEEAWKGVLLNQFHDILPGSSIARVYEEAEALYDEVIAAADGVTADAAVTLTDGDEGLTVFNDLSWTRTGLVPLPADYEGAADAEGRSLPVQKVGDEMYAQIVAPACGWTAIRAADPVEIDNPLKAETGLLENEHLRVTFNDRGEITSIYDKDADRELAAGACNAFEMYKDVPTKFDAWDIDSVYEKTPVALETTAQVEVLASGPLVATLRVTRTLHNSEMTQEISLQRGSRRVEFKTEIDWQERHKLLKVAFPVNIHANEAIHEIQFGYIERPNHRSRQFDIDRFEVANHKWTALAEANRGCAVLNDSKYGVNVLDNAIKLTLLKAALAPDMTADLGLQCFTYAFYAWNGAFVDSDVVREGYELNAPLMTAPGVAETQSLFGVDAPNVIIDTVKPAEDGSDDVIVRLYESKRMATRCALTTALPVQSAQMMDMLERETLETLDVADGSIALEFRPFEIKTVRLS